MLPMLISEYYFFKSHQARSVTFLKGYNFICDELIKSCDEGVAAKPEAECSFIYGVQRGANTGSLYNVTNSLQSTFLRPQFH